MDSKPHADVYRMATDDHLCPWGLKTVDLLEREDFVVDDHKLESRAETDAFMEATGVDTTPQVFIDGERIGGYEDLREHLGKSVRDEDEKTYQPVVAVFAIAALAALGVSWSAYGDFTTVRAAEWFVALSMAMLAMLKLRDIRSFSTMFLNYDLLARRWVPYSYIYPFAEALAAVLMIAGVLTFISAPIALFIGTVGAVSVIKAVWVDRRELECACVGGDTNVPLGFVSLTENLFMIGMGIWMPLKPYLLS